MRLCYSIKGLVFRVVGFDVVEFNDGEEKRKRLGQDEGGELCWGFKEPLNNFGELTKNLKENIGT